MGAIEFFSKLDGCSFKLRTNLTVTLTHCYLFMSILFYLEIHSKSQLDPTLDQSIGEPSHPCSFDVSITAYQSRYSTKVLRSISAIPQQVRI